MIRDIQNIDDDIIRKKRVISEMIYSDPDIIEVLDNSELDDYKEIYEILNKFKNIK